MKGLDVDAVIGDIETGRVGVEQPHEFIASGLGRDDAASGAAQ